MVDCRVCGACCLEYPLFECSQGFYEQNHELLEMRGLKFKKIEGKLFCMSQPCKYLNIGNGLFLCTIHETKPDVCKEQQPGSQPCLEARRFKDKATFIS